jgi:ATP-binding cassette subfamily B protein
MEIQRALVEQMRDRTVIAVAHRLSTLVVFDRVIVLNGGRIVEDGTMLELRRRGGLFDRMWRLQADQVRFPQEPEDAASEEAA